MELENWFHFNVEDAFWRINGKEYQSESDVVDKVIEHMSSFKPERDYREAVMKLPFHNVAFAHRIEVRRIEHDLLHKYGYILAGNQAMDYHKQDGLTEIGEWAEAATVGTFKFYNFYTGNLSFNN